MNFNINTGEIITFVLAAFSTLTVIIPFVNQQQPVVNQGFETDRFRAVQILLDNYKPWSLGSRLWAYNKLHEYGDMNETYVNIIQNEKTIHIRRNIYGNMSNSFENIIYALNKLKNNSLTVHNLAQVENELAVNDNNIHNNFKNIPTYDYNYITMNNSIQSFFEHKSQYKKIVDIFHVYDHPFIINNTSSIRIINNDINSIDRYNHNIKANTNSLINDFIKAKIEMTIMAYNSNHKYLKYIDSKTTTNDASLKREVWYALRLQNLENNRDNTKLTEWYEDKTCRGPRINNDPSNHIALCNYNELIDINSNLTTLEQNGNKSDYYNDNNKVHSLQRPLETFLSDMNYFIIASFITGPVVFWAAIKIYNRVTE